MVGNNLKKIINEKGISAKFLAEKVKVSATHLSYVLNGKRNLSVDLASRIADALGVNMSQLFHEESDDLYTAFGNTAPETFAPIQKSVFDLITFNIDRHGKEFSSMLAEFSDVSEKFLLEAISSIDQFMLLPIDIQSRIFSNVFDVSEIINKKNTNTINKEQKKPKDLLKILEQEQELTMNGELLSQEDIEVIKSALEQGYYLAKRLNKRK